MHHSTSFLRAAAIVAATSLGAACVEPPDDGALAADEHGLTRGDGVAAPGRASICWSTSGLYSADVGNLIVASGFYFDRSWKAHSAATRAVTSCDPGATSVRIAGFDATWLSPSQRDDATTVTLTSTAPRAATIALPLVWNSAVNRFVPAGRVDWAMVHVWGIALGFRPQGCAPGGGPAYSANDAASVMNTCEPRVNTTGALSPSDIMGARAALGWRNPTDYDGNGATDGAVFRPTGALAGQWTSPLGGAFHYGAWGDLAIAGDFDHDGWSDPAIWRPSNGYWSIKNSTGAADTIFQWGAWGDLPMVADLDGDGRTEFIVFRPSTRMWYVRHESGATEAFGPWGAAGDVPAVADYDGDGRSDFARWRPSTGVWTARLSSYLPWENLYPGVATLEWPLGQAGDVPVPGDYDGDHKADMAFYRPGTGLWMGHLATGVDFTRFVGAGGDRPLAARPTDAATDRLTVWTPATGRFAFADLGGSLSPVSVLAGGAGDVPVGTPPMPY